MKTLEAYIHELMILREEEVFNPLGLNTHPHWNFLIFKSLLNFKTLTL